MGKKIIAVLCIICMLLGITACQKTPEEAVVVDKSQGLPEGSIIPEEKDTPKDLRVPEHWKESLVRGDGFVTLEADLDLEIPEVYNTPVYSWEAVPMTDQFLKKLCDYFAEGDRIYEYQGMTKSELIEKKEKMEKQEGSYVYSYYEELQKKIEKMEELIEKAPAEKGEKKYIEPKLMKPQMIEIEQLDPRNYIGRGYYPWYYSTEKEIGFLARVDRGEPCDPLIRAVSYDKDVGSVSAYVYEQGTWTNQRSVERNIKLMGPVAANGKYLEYMESMKSKMEQAEYENFTEEDARKMVGDIVKDLGIKDMEVVDCARAMGVSDMESWSGLDTEDPDLEYGYSFSLSPKAGDVNGYTLLFSNQYKDLPETSYAPTFLTTQISIVVTEEGVKSFEWDYISDKKDMIAENTKLLSFDEVKEKLADHLLYAELSDENGEIPPDASYVYDVQNVQLRAANINAYEDPDAAWLVPVWVFEVGLTGFFEYDGGKVHENDLPEGVVQINAIDGGYVTVNF